MWCITYGLVMVDFLLLLNNVSYVQSMFYIEGRELMALGRSVNLYVEIGYYRVTINCSNWLVWTDYTKNQSGVSPMITSMKSIHESVPFKLSVVRLYIAALC